jgi:hypothetical protein
MQSNQHGSFVGLTAQLFASALELIKGPSNLSEIVSTKSEIESLMGHSVHDYTVNIHCHEKRYLCRYRRWYVPNQEKTVYHVYTVVSENTPRRLKELCAKERHFPKLLGVWMPSASQKEAAIEAYLDLILDEFNKA